MEQSEFGRLKARVVEENVQRRLRDAEQLEEQRRNLTEQERFRVENLQANISTWLDAMKEADYPNLQLLSVFSHIEQRLAKKSLLGFKRMEEVPVYKEELGWRIGEKHNVEYAHERSDVPYIDLYLLVDGRLVQNLKGEYQLGSDFELEDNAGYRLPSKAYVKNSPWRIAENTIPEHLQTLADEANVEWVYRCEMPST